jgi:hypothetical protein
MKKFLAENKLGPYSRINENVEEAKTPVSKEQKIQVIKEWIWFTCEEGQATDDINMYNKMVDMYFANKNDVTKQDFKNIWNKVIEKWGVGDTGADSEGFPETWRDIQTGTLVNPGMTYEGKEKEKSNENMNVASRIMAYADENKDKTSLEDTISGMLKYMSKEKILQYFKQMLVNSDKEKKEGYMGTQYDSSEDMAVDMVKTGIREMPSRIPSRMNRQTPDQRMEDIANQRYLAKFAEVAMMIAQDLDADGFDEQDIKRFLMTKLDDLILTEGTDIEKSLNEMITPSQIKLIQNIIDNWSDGGIDAEPAMMRIDKILMGDMSDEELDDEDLTGLNEALAPQSYERMSNLSNLKAQQAMIKAAEIMMNELTAEGFEVEEVREFFTQLIANDI